MTHNPAAPSGSNVQEIAVSDIDALLPCPFCAGTDVSLEDAGYNGFSFVRCVTCWSAGSESDSKEEAIAAWNRRAPALRQQESRTS